MFACFRFLVLAQFMLSRKFRMSVGETLISQNFFINAADSDENFNSAINYSTKISFKCLLNGNILNILKAQSQLAMWLIDGWDHEWEKSENNWSSIAQWGKKGEKNIKIEVSRFKQRFLMLQLFPIQTLTQFSPNKKHNLCCEIVDFHFKWGASKKKIRFKFKNNCLARL